MDRIRSLALVVALTLSSVALGGDHAWTSVAPIGGMARHFTGNDGGIYFASYTRVYRSSDAGATWTVAVEYPQRINALAARGDLVLAAVDEIGIRRSNDDGATWQSITLMNTNLAQGFVSDVAIAPSGDAFAVHTGAGIFKSTDGGDHWIALPSQPTDGVLSVAVSPIDETVLFAGTSGAGVFKSVDGGESWTAANAGLPTDFEAGLLELGPDGETLLLGGGGAPNAFYRSGDAGASWESVSINLNSHFLYAAAFDPADAAMVYAAFVSTGVDTRPRIYASHNHGVTWSVVSNPDTAYPPEVYGLYFETGRLIAGTLRGNFVSSDGGANWQPSNTGFANTSLYDFALSATQPGHLYATSTGELLGGQVGVFRSMDGGTSWETRNGNLELHPEGFTAISANPHFDDALVVARMHNRTGTAESIYSTVDAGTSWVADANAVSDRGPRVFAHHPTDSSIVYALADSGVLRSVDGGMSWAVHSTGLPAGDSASRRALVIAPSNPDVLYAGTAEGVYRSDDGGVTWEARRGSLGDAKSTAIALHPLNEDIVYASFERSRGLASTTDGGRTWSRVFDFGPVNAIGLDPRDPNRLLVLGRQFGSAHRAYASIDAGTTWAFFHTGLQTRYPEGMTETWAKVAFDPHVENRYYALVGGVLHVYDGNLSTDISITLTISPASADVGDAVVAEFEVTNESEEPATDIEVSIGIPGEFEQLAGGQIDDSGCGGDFGFAICAIASLAPGESRVGQFNLTATRAGSGTLTVRVTPRQIDTSPENNEYQAAYTINGPATPPPTGGGGGGHAHWLWLLTMLFPMRRRFALRKNFTLIRV